MPAAEEEEVILVVEDWGGVGYGGGGSGGGEPGRGGPGGRGPGGGGGHLPGCLTVATLILVPLLQDLLSRPQGLRRTAMGTFYGRKKSSRLSTRSIIEYLSQMGKPRSFRGSKYVRRRHAKLERRRP